MRISVRVAMAAAVLVRLPLIALGYGQRGLDAFLVSDSVSYVILARHLAFDSAFLDRWKSGRPELFRTPGYPLVLVPGTVAERPIAVAIALNVLFSVALVVVTYRLARRLFDDEGLAALCALVVAVEPTLLTWSLKVMPETLFTFCLLLFAEAALQALETDRARWIAAAAVALVAAAYLRPIAYPLVICVAIAALFVPGPRLRRALVFAVTAAALLGPWHLRNAIQTGYGGFSTVTERSLYFSGGGAVLAAREHRPYAEVRQDLYDHGRMRGAVADATRYRQMRSTGFALIASNPLAWGVAHGRGMLRTLFDPGAAEYLRLIGLYAKGARSPWSSGDPATISRAYPLLFWSSVALGAVLLPLVLLPLLGAVRVPRERRTPFLLLALVAGYLVFASGGPPGNYRFRAPVVPFLVLMSAYSCNSVRRSAPRD